MSASAAASRAGPWTQGGQRAVLAGQGVPGFFEQADLLAVEELDLEPGGGPGVPLLPDGSGIAS